MNVINMNWIQLYNHGIYLKCHVAFAYRISLLNSWSSDKAK